MSTPRKSTAPLHAVPVGEAPASPLLAWGESPPPGSDPGGGAQAAGEGQQPDEIPTVDPPPHAAEAPIGTADPVGLDLQQAMEDALAIGNLALAHLEPERPVVLESSGFFADVRLQRDRAANEIASVEATIAHERDRFAALLAGLEERRDDLHLIVTAADRALNREGDGQ